jgi:hypothetical protein
MGVGARGKVMTQAADMCAAVDFGFVKADYPGMMCRSDSS